jgi:hypothetical protein
VHAIVLCGPDPRTRSHNEEIAMGSSSPLNVATDIFASPNEAFAAIKERPSVWLPILVLVVLYCVVSFTYMNAVDLPWFMDQQLQNAGGDITAEQRERAAAAAANVSPLVYGAIGAVSSTLFIAVWLSLTALYYTGISFATSDGTKFKQWFALLWWCTLPVVLGLLAALVNVLVGDARFMLQDEINPLSFGNLFSIDTEGATVLQRVLLGLDPSTLWSVVLTVLGYQAFTKRSMLASVAVVLGPIAVIVAIGVLVSLA